MQTKVISTDEKCMLVHGCLCEGRHDCMWTFAFLFIALHLSSVTTILVCHIIVLKTSLWYDDLWNEYFVDRVKFVLSPDVILCGWLGAKYQLTNLLTN